MVHKPNSGRIEHLGRLREVALGCVRCPLAAGRTQVVFGDGDPDARLAVVGEAPGREEDATGRPFLGAAGKNLDLFLTGIGLERKDVYIANVAMCRPPENRPVRRAEMLACASHLDDQIELVEPAVVIALGESATKRFLGMDATVRGSRGQAHQVGRALVVPTYHPSPLSLNRAPERRMHIESDFRLALSLLLAHPASGH